MAAAHPRLTKALATRYRLERELGSGGMATVYLAEDLKHHRKVAVKVLKPELAATLGAERFSKEIETVAGFQHPHILPLLDSGHVGGFLYYVMPYVEGESLRDRLARQGELPIHDAVKILVEVTGAPGAGAARRATARVLAGALAGDQALPRKAAGRRVAERRGPPSRARAARHAKRRHDADDGAADRRLPRKQTPRSLAAAGRGR